MRIAVTFDPVEPGDPSLSGWIQVLTDDGAPAEPPRRAPDLAAMVADRERADAPRWVWAATETEYPRLLSAGVRVERCHDIALTEALLLARAGRPGEPRSLAAAWARLRGMPVPPDPRPVAPQKQTALFGIEASGTPGVPDASQQLEMLVAVHADQLRRIAAETATAAEAATAAGATAASTRPARSVPSVPSALATLVAAESAGGLVAAEIAACGVPWRVDAHDAVLTELLGPRPFGDALPGKLAELGVRVGEAFGYAPGRGFNPDSPTQVLRALRHAGFSVNSTRAWELREIKHPGVELLLEYKELSRLHAAHGWAWQDAWVRDGRFRPEYVVGGVVSGRLGHPQQRRVADSTHHAPRRHRGRGLVARRRGRGPARAEGARGRIRRCRSGAGRGVRRPVRGVGCRGVRRRPRQGEGSPARRDVRTDQRRHRTAARGAAQAFPGGHGVRRGGGEDGRARRGRVLPSRPRCPPPSARWRRVVSGLDGVAGADIAAEADSDAYIDASADAAPYAAADAGFADADGNGDGGMDAGAASGMRSGQAARSRGRFTRNFVIQASAADWALVWLAVLRRKLSELGSPAGMDRARGPDGSVPDGDMPHDAVSYDAVPRDAVPRDTVPRDTVPHDTVPGTAADLATKPHLVFFVHDEVVVHTPKPLAEQAAKAVAESADEARRIVFGPTPVRFPLAAAIVDCYADAK